MQDFTLSTRRQAGHTVVALDGELDLHTAQELRAKLLPMCTVSGSRMLVDVSRLRFCDAAGLEVLLGAHERAHRAGGSFALIAPRRPVAKVLCITGLDGRFTIHPSIAAAVVSSAHSAAAATTTTPADMPAPGPPARSQPGPPCAAV